MPDAFKAGELGFVDSTEFNQGFLKREGERLTGRDLIVLKAQPLKDNDFTADSRPSRLRSGAFPLNRPAVFFGKTYPTTIDRTGEAEGDERVRMTSSAAAVEERT